MAAAQILTQPCGFSPGTGQTSREGLRRPNAMAEVALVASSPDFMEWAPNVGESALVGFSAHGAEPKRPGLA